MPIECAGPGCNEVFEPVVYNQKYHTRKCKRAAEIVNKKKEYAEDLEEVLSANASDKAPRVLLLDIETSPNLVYTWGLWNQNIGLNQIASTSKVICFSAKWLGSGKKNVMFHSVYDGGHEAMVKAAWDLLDESDAVIHYNGASFDIPHLNREFLEAGLGPPSAYQNVDLYKLIRKFKFQSRKLDHISTELGLEGKVSHEGFDLWLKCLDGNAKAWKTMEKYNKRDVTLMEDLYEILLPWLSALPNYRLYDAEAGCPRCGAKHVQRRGITRTATSVFQQYQCQKCKGWFRDTCRVVGVDSRTIAPC